MRISILLIVLGLVYTACEQVRIIDENELIEFTFVKGEKLPYSGYSEEYYDNGNLRQEAFYKWGQLHGHFIEYYITGDRESEGEYIDGNRDGIWYHNEENTSTHSEATFKNDRYHGSVIVWFDNGTREEVTFENGIMHGPYKSFYPNGAQEEESRYVDGDIHGLVTKWDEKGKKIYSGEYEKGKPVWNHTQ
jgi:antitoxin component YwqK of YwqJK toxin-antitoxin module